MLTPFKKSELGDSFLDNGYCSFPLLDKEEVKFALTVYDQINGNKNRLQEPQFYGVNYSLGTLSQKQNHEAMDPLVKILYQKLSVYFESYELLGCVFISKPAHTEVEFEYHQDWSYTDEGQNAFVTCWIPLCDVNIQNGCMSFINGSHHFFKTFRSDTLESARIPFHALPEELKSDISLKAGQCVAFHQAAFHGSHPNNSDQNRPVLAVVVKPSNAPVLLFSKSSKTINVFEIATHDFDKMLTEIPKTRIQSSAKLIDTIENIPTIPSSASIIINWRIHQPEHKLFKNNLQHRLFNIDGYLKLNNVLSPDIIKELKELYADNYSTPDGMYVTHHSVTDENKNKKMSDKIFALIQSALVEIFDDFQPLISHYAVKKQGKFGLFNFHQDWSIISENSFAVLHCWIPLQDVDKYNGTLAVLPGSHVVFNNYRSGTCPIRFTPIDSYNEFTRHISAKVGDIVFYHPALFHGSGVNYSPDQRLAVVAAIGHIKADKIYYHRKDKEIFSYVLTEKDLFSRLDELAKGAEPIGKKIRKVPFALLSSTDDELKEKIVANCLYNQNAFNVTD